MRGWWKASWGGRLCLPHPSRSGSEENDNDFSYGKALDYGNYLRRVEDRAIGGGLKNPFMSWPVSVSCVVWM